MRSFCTVCDGLAVTVTGCTFDNPSSRPSIPLSAFHVQCRSIRWHSLPISDPGGAAAAYAGLVTDQFDEKTVGSIRSSVSDTRSIDPTFDDRLRAPCTLLH